MVYLQGQRLLFQGNSGLRAASSKDQKCFTSSGVIHYLCFNILSICLVTADILRGLQAMFQNCVW